MIPAVTLITIVSLLAFLIMFFLIKTVLDIQRKKIEANNREVTQIGFVVNTFHDLVAKLKEKERELEDLRKMAEERAGAVEIYNEDILQSVPSGVVSFDQDMRIKKMNASAENILEMKQADVLMKESRKVFHSPITDLLARRETVERAEISYITGSGKWIWLGLNVSPLKDSSDRNIGQLLVFTDLTELKAFQSGRT